MSDTDLEPPLETWKLRQNRTSHSECPGRYGLVTVADVSTVHTKVKSVGSDLCQYRTSHSGCVAPYERAGERPGRGVAGSTIRLLSTGYRIALHW
eukprot:498621-Rhodomonas_salina.2